MKGLGLLLSDSRALAQAPDPLEEDRVRLLTLTMAEDITVLDIITDKWVVEVVVDIITTKEMVYIGPMVTE